MWTTIQPVSRCGWVEPLLSKECVCLTEEKAPGSSVPEMKVREIKEEERRGVCMYVCGGGEEWRHNIHSGTRLLIFSS